MTSQWRLTYKKSDGAWKQVNVSDKSQLDLWFRFLRANGLNNFRAQVREVSDWAEFSLTESEQANTEQV